LARPGRVGVVACGYGALSPRSFGHLLASLTAGAATPLFAQRSNEEYGIVSRTEAVDAGIAARFPLGTRLRILPNHPCATGAQHPEYRAVGADGEVHTWPRFHG